MRKPFFRQSRKRWYVLHDGRYVNLGPDKAEAFKRFHKLAAGQTEPAPVTATVGEIVTQFLEWTKAHRSKLTSDWYCQFLDGFKAMHGRLKVTAVKPYHVTRWIDSKGYAGTTERRAVETVSRAFNWAVDEGVLPKNPLPRLKRPAATPRECYISPAQWKVVIAKANSLSEYLEFARATGARPQEIRAIEKRHFDPVLKAIVFPRDESKGKRQQRVISLSPTALAMVQRLVLKYPEGPIFRNTNGDPWNRHTLTTAFRRLTKRVGFKVFAYSIRHTWATDALVNGVDPITVATLMGHKNLKMLMETYQKIQVRQDHIQAAVRRATGEVA